MSKNLLSLFPFFLTLTTMNGQIQQINNIDSVFNFCYFESIVSKGLKKTDVDNRFGFPYDSVKYFSYNEKTDKHDIPEYHYNYRVFKKFGAITILTITVESNKENKISHLRLNIPTQSQWFLETVETKKCDFKFLKTIGKIDSDQRTYYVNKTTYCSVTDQINSDQKIISIGLRSNLKM